MKYLLKYPLKFARKLYFLATKNESKFGRNWKSFSNKEYSNDLIYKCIMHDKPCMISRLGSTEILCVINYLGIKQHNTKLLDFIKGNSEMWWWETSTINQLEQCAGFFPSQITKVEQFSELMLNDMPQIDILGSWLKEESFFAEELMGAKRVVLEDLEPFFTPNPWTRALSGKKVLVVHPFADTIEIQYKKRSVLFSNDLLPDFELTTIKAVQSAAREETAFNDWFEALEWMKRQIDKVDYEVCIIGCGAYGLPLAAHVKRMGKKAIHLGGVTQLLFGIKGKRWEEFVVWPYNNLFNEHWVRPGNNEKPRNAVMIEGACYW